MKILITDSFSRKTFDVYHTIKDKFPKKAVILTSDCGGISSTLIYLKKTLPLRSSTFKIFCQDLKRISDLYKDEKIVFIPVNEDKILLFYRFIERYGNLNFQSYLPSSNDFLISRNKFLLNEFCINEGIPSPKLFKNRNAINQSNFVPIIIKPRVGSGSIGIKKIDSFQGIEELSVVNLEDYVIQELLPNGRDVRAGFYLCENGRVINRYCHERIRTYPLSGGVSVYSKIIKNEEIELIGEEIIKKLNWSGLLMIEFLYDHRDGKYKVIEINPRLWGSIMLSEFSNVSLLANYINLNLGLPLEKNAVDFNKKIRWIVFDLISLVKAKGRIANFLKISKRDTCYVNMTYSNPWSVLVFHLLFYFSLKNLVRFLKK